MRHGVWTVMKPETPGLSSGNTEYDKASGEIVQRLMNEIDPGIILSNKDSSLGTNRHDL